LLSAAAQYNGPLCELCRKRLGVASPAPKSPRQAETATTVRKRATTGKRAYDVDSDDDGTGGAGYVDVRTIDQLKLKSAAASAKSPSSHNYVEAPPLPAGSPAAARSPKKTAARQTQKKRNKSEAPATAKNSKGNGNNRESARHEISDSSGDEYDEEAMERMKAKARQVAREKRYVFREIDYRELDLEQKIGAGSFGEVYKATWRGAPGTLQRAVCTQQNSHI
jgi:hypothetical protein